MANAGYRPTASDGEPDSVSYGKAVMVAASWGDSEMDSDRLNRWLQVIAGVGLLVGLALVIVQIH